MALLEASQIEVILAGTTVLDGVSLTIEPQEKVGLIGANGSGKTTLVRTLIGAIEPDGGTVRTLTGETTRAAYVPQHFPSTYTGNAGAFPTRRLRAMREELHTMEEAMAHATPEELSKILSLYGTLRERYDAADGDRAEERATALLDRLHLSHIHDTPIQNLSGGEKNRLQIADALIDRPDLLILDEPGNHMDAWGLSWLEELLRDYPAGVLIISHNRYLLDRVAHRILHITNGQVTSHRGNYSAFKSAQLRQAVATARDARADQRKLDRLETMVNRLAQLARAKPDPAIGRRLRARRTQLEWARTEARERPDLTEEKAAIRLNAPHVRADVALELVNLSLHAPPSGDAERTLLKGVKLRIAAGERVALVGPNGCGKTTLLRAIVSEGHWDHPHVRVGPSMRIGYCSQHQELFDPQLTVIDTMALLAAWGRDQLFGLLSRYRFTYEDLDRPVGTLSGGERNRLQIARAELIGANFLILDEPTNHLDIPSREVVEEALRSFRGTILVVSHDRYFLDILVERVLAFHDQTILDIPGGFSEYWHHIGHQARKGTTRQPRTTTRGDTVPGSPAAIEERLLSLEEEKVHLERRLHTAYQNDNLTEASRLSAQLTKATRLYNALYRQWE